MDIFEYAHQNKVKQEAPLAYRLRPRTLEEVKGQKHILAEGSQLYRAIKADRLSSVIFFWTFRNRKDYACESDSQYHFFRVQTDQCHHCW